MRKPEAGEKRGAVVTIRFTKEERMIILKHAKDDRRGIGNYLRNMILEKLTGKTKNNG
jgi:hypothetical protein